MTQDVDQTLTRDRGSGSRPLSAPAIRLAGASLRLRLFVLVLAPLIVMSIALGYWRFSVAKDTAETLFDRALLSTALAVSRDVAISGGDALLPSTLDMMGDAAGGQVFYHVTGPGGIYVTGYAYPPIGGGDVAPEGDPGLPVYYQARYRSEPVRVVRITETISLGAITGRAVVTVWQRLSERDAFARQLALRALVLLGVLLGTVALMVWFGVQRGLRPLRGLHEAIALRSPDDLSRIRRAVPAEMQGIVATLNRLFGQLRQNMTAQQSFISDAAHQLRNPAAGILSMAEAARDARTDDERRRRVDELTEAARANSRLVDQLLSLERLRRSGADTNAEQDDTFDLTRAVQDLAADEAARILARDIDLELEGTSPALPALPALPVSADRVFVLEAIKNLIDNSLSHGGPHLSRIGIRVWRERGFALVTVQDDGIGLRPEDQDRAFRRFGQVHPSAGSGLGLAIVQSVADRHGGLLRIDPVDRGASVTLGLPLAADPGP